MKLTVCLLIPLVATLLGAVDEQSVTVKSVSIDGHTILVNAELRGKPDNLTCTNTSPSCSKPQPGEYSMVRATGDEAVYEDCTNVVLYYNSSGTHREKVGVYCWLGSGDCYVVSCVPIQVDTLPATIKEEPLSALTASAQDAPPSDCADVQAAAIVCLTQTQMSTRAEHIEMQPDRMGNHVNVSGVAVFELMVGKNGHVLEAKVISGHPLAVPLLMGSVNKWRFRPLQRDGVAWRVCGRLSVKFSVVENQPKLVKVVRP